MVSTSALFAHRLLFGREQLEGSQTYFWVSFHEIFIFIFHFGRLQPSSWFHAVESRLFFLAYWKLVLGHLTLFSHGLKDTFNLALLLICVKAKLIGVGRIGEGNIGDVLETILSGTASKCVTDKFGHFLGSEEALDIFAWNFFLKGGRWKLLSFKILVDFLPEFLHLGSALVDADHKGWGNFHKRILRVVEWHY